MSAETLRRAAAGLRHEAELMGEEPGSLQHCMADLLDAEAQSHFHLGNEVKSSYDLPGMDDSPAMRVARAYLGES